MTAKVRFITLVSVLLMAAGGGSLSAGPVRAQEDCLSVPNVPPPQGSHWYYRTDPVKQSKCWYLRTEGQAIQKQAAQEKPKTAVIRRAATTSNTAPNQLGSEPLELRPVQVTPATSSDRATIGSIQHNTRAKRQVGANKVAWPDPPAPAGADKVAWPDPPAPAGAEQVTWPDPPPPAGADKVAWPDPPPRAGADKVAWPDPPAAAGADKVAWPNPTSPVRGVTPEAAAESTREEREKRTLEVPATAPNSNKDARNDTGVGRQVTEAAARAGSQSEMPAGMLLAFAVGLVIAGIIMRRVVKMTFARQRTVQPDRREPILTTGVASERMKLLFAEEHHDVTPVSLGNDHLDDEVKEALRKLLRVLDEQAV